MQQALQESQIMVEPKSEEQKLQVEVYKDDNRSVSQIQTQKRDDAIKLKLEQFEISKKVEHINKISSNMMDFIKSSDTMLPGFAHLDINLKAYEYMKRLNEISEIITRHASKFISYIQKIMTKIDSLKTYAKRLCDKIKKLDSDALIYTESYFTVTHDLVEKSINALLDEKKNSNHTTIDIVQPKLLEEINKIYIAIQPVNNLNELRLQLDVKWDQQRIELRDKRIQEQINLANCKGELKMKKADIEKLEIKQEDLEKQLQLKEEFLKINKQMQQNQHEKQAQDSQSLINELQDKLNKRKEVYEQQQQKSQKNYEKNIANFDQKTMEVSQVFTDGINTNSNKRCLFHVILVIDTSGSMKGEFKNVKAAMRTIIQKFQDDGQQHLLSIILFESTARITSRMVSINSSTIIDPTWGGTNFYDAMIKLKDVVDQTPVSHTPLSVFLTDGEDSYDKPCQVLQSIFLDSVNKSKGFLFFTIAFGTDVGSDSKSLVAMTEAANGGKIKTEINNKQLDLLYNCKTVESLNEVFQGIATKCLELDKLNLVMEIMTQGRDIIELQYQQSKKKDNINYKEQQNIEEQNFDFASKHCQNVSKKSQNALKELENQITLQIQELTHKIMDIIKEKASLQSQVNELVSEEKYLTERLNPEEEAKEFESITKNIQSELNQIDQQQKSIHNYRDQGWYFFNEEQNQKIQVYADNIKKGFVSIESYEKIFFITLDLLCENIQNSISIMKDLQINIDARGLINDIQQSMLVSKGLIQENSNMKIDKTKAKRMIIQNILEETETDDDCIEFLQQVFMDDKCFIMHEDVKKDEKIIENFIKEVNEKYAKETTEIKQQIREVDKSIKNLENEIKKWEEDSDKYRELNEKIEEEKSKLYDLKQDLKSDTCNEEKDSIKYVQNKFQSVRYQYTEEYHRFNNWYLKDLLKENFCSAFERTVEILQEFQMLSNKAMEGQVLMSKQKNSQNLQLK